ncbi:shikimate dehydrogenase [Rugosibacter aromaticivorans]|uniref:shikimate dehydrogenase n=1 Tax=Rugosibacter aromaticivorans TaxID=1565605 RepID=UPI001F01206A|nr:shikimate dehydrogenase [Rugosibacter aromaticivorans]
MPTECMPAERYAVFGNPVSHSLSPKIHALFAAQTGQDIRYEAICAPLDGFAEAVNTFIAAGGKGANVTVPFKVEAFNFARQLTPRAQAAGAVNTLSFAADGLRGDNTDGAGLVRDLVANLGVPLAGLRVLVLGAGGAARGVILPLREQNPAELFIANRTADKAQVLAGVLGVTGGGFDDLNQRTFDLVINATSAGLSGAALPTPTFSPDALAYEMVYGVETPFMQTARAAGARVADGLGMLVEQAAEAFYVWRGMRPDTAPVLAALRAQLRAQLNVHLTPRLNA